MGPVLSLLIVVPTLESHALLHRLVRSLQRQSWPHWRLLFIDGPSGAEHRRWLSQCCRIEPRCRWQIQDPQQPGIFGAMNQGFAVAADPASPADWLLFWGSDDWAASPTALADAIAVLETASPWPDLIVCRGRYADPISGAPGRASVFHAAGLLDAAAYRRALWRGSTPPHQATLFGPGARRRLDRYAPGFALTGDLDHFLQLSRQPDLRVQCLDLELVNMGAGGISGRQTRRRLQEVGRAYVRAFGIFWGFPFVARYLRRLASALPVRRRADAAARR